MKLTAKKLKSLIREVVDEKAKDSMILTEATQWSQYNRIMDLFSGEVGSVDQVVIMSPMNPHAKVISQDKEENRIANEKRKEAFLEDLKRAGFGYRFIEGMYGDPEDSYIIPHMSANEATFYCYKYAQESFVYSVRQDPVPSPDDVILHQMCYINFKDPQQDPNYPEEIYGKMYVVPDSATHTVGEETTDMNDFSKMASASNFYSAVPKKGPKAGPKFSMDFDFDTGKKGNIGKPMSNPRNPKYPRLDETYISIKESDIPNTKEAKQLVESIKDRAFKINEKDRIGSSRWRERLKMNGEKKKLLKLIKSRK
jgi:hypothetical protein